MVGATRTAVVPMLAEPQNGRDIATLVGTHTFDVKLDGVRSVATWEDGNLTLTNRSGREQTVSYPDLGASCPLSNQLKGTRIVLDGEIIALTGSFEDVARRDKVTKPADVTRMVGQIPVQFLAFDILQLGDDDLRSFTYRERRLMLETIVGPVTNQQWGLTIVSNDASLFDHVRQLGMEGVIAKRTDSPYRAGRRPDWVKFKNTHRVTCVAVGYELGEGSRSHFGAMFLAMVNDAGQVVPVGRVGSGFTTDDTYDCKARLDARQPFLVEIEVANVTKDGKLRFPVFKGVRTDVSLKSAVLSQLASIPRS